MLYPKTSLVVQL
jgi:hypothetical protein